MIMKRSLDPRLRARWDALIADEGAALGIADCRPFFENKLVNDIFYEGTFKGRPCIVKCSSRAPESIANEYAMSRRLSAVDPSACAEALACWTSPDGRMAFVVTQRLPGPSLTEMIARGVEADEAIGVMEDVVRIAGALLSAGIVWRDIIPDNFMMDDGGHLRLIDAQFAIDRNAFREDPYLAAHRKYRLLLFAHHPDMAGRGWNDVAMMLHFTRNLPSAARVKELRARLREMLADAAFPVAPSAGDVMRMMMYGAVLRLRLLAHPSAKKVVTLRERLARVRRFVADRREW